MGEFFSYFDFYSFHTVVFTVENTFKFNIDHQSYTQKYTSCSSDYMVNWNDLNNNFYLAKHLKLHMAKSY